MSSFSRKVGVSSLMALLATNFACCCRHHPPTYLVLADGHNAIFNPSGSPVPLTEFGRLDWPVAYVSESTGEDIQYHEQIVDIQGRGFNRDDGFLLRRFESDRFGRSRR
jgi:hypothetical protein